MNEEFMSKEIMDLYACMGSERDRLVHLIKEYNALNEKINNLLAKRDAYESDIATALGYIESCKFQLIDLKDEDALEKNRATLQAYINSMKNAFEENEKMKAEYEDDILWLEQELEQRKQNKFDDAEFYKMKIAELDCVLQWFGY